MLLRRRALPQRHARAHCHVVTCARGFGAPKQKAGRSVDSKGPARTAEQAADLAEAAANSPKVRPINRKEAARGKVDYVQVKDWADGKASDIGELQVRPDGYTAEAYTAGGGGKTAGPFYQQLAHHAQYLESQGALSLALEPGAKPFLPFESWQYTVPRYRQYLAELAAVHEALEEALQLALAAPPPAGQSIQQSADASSSSSEDISDDRSHLSTTSSSSQHDSGQQKPAPWAVPGRAAHVSSAYAALSCFGPESGFWRAQAAATDFARLLELAAADNKEQQQHEQIHHIHQPQQQQQQQSQHKDRVDTSHKEHVRLHSSQNAVAYGRYLLQLGRSAAAATAAEQISSSSGSSKRASSRILVAEEEEGYLAVLKLLAHAYAIHVQQQCLGTRIGAAATEQLGLMAAGVSALYMDYPSHVKEPLQQLVAATNTAGRKLDSKSKQIVFEELPKALKKSTLLLSPLATA